MAESLSPTENDEKRTSLLSAGSGPVRPESDLVLELLVWQPIWRDRCEPFLWFRSGYRFKNLPTQHLLELWHLTDKVKLDNKCNNKVKNHGPHQRAGSSLSTQFAAARSGTKWTQLSYTISRDDGNLSICKRGALGNLCAISWIPVTILLWSSYHGRGLADSARNR